MSSNQLQYVALIFFSISWQLFCLSSGYSKLADVKAKVCPLVKSSATMRESKRLEAERIRFTRRILLRTRSSSCEPDNSVNSLVNSMVFSRSVQTLQSLHDKFHSVDALILECNGLHHDELG